LARIASEPAASELIGLQRRLGSAGVRRWRCRLASLADLVGRAVATLRRGLPPAAAAANSDDWNACFATTAAERHGRKSERSSHQDEATARIGKKGCYREMLLCVCHALGNTQAACHATAQPK